MQRIRAEEIHGGKEKHTRDREERGRTYVQDTEHVFALGSERKHF